MKKGHRHLYASEETCLKSKVLKEMRQKQVIGYESKDKKFYKYSRDFHKNTGLTICFLSWLVAYIDASLGTIFFGVGLFIYFSGPPLYAKKIYLYNTTDWKKSYSTLEYKDNKCPHCGADVNMFHKLVTECPGCNKKMCQFGAELKTT